MTDQFVGTPAFAAPEHLRGGPDAIDVRSDVYSLGVVLFNALTGSMPYKVSGDLPEVFRNIEQAEPVRPSSVCGSVDREIESIVLKALSKDKDRRYQTVDAMAEDLRRYVQGEPILAHPPSTFYQVRKLVKRHRLPFALAALVFGVVLAFAITAAYQAQRIRLERDQSRLDQAKAEAVSEFLRTMFASANPEQSGHDVRVVDVLERAETKIDSGFDEQPEVRVVLHSTLGETYFGLGLYEQADESYQAALRAATTSLGDDHELTLDAMSSLGVIRSARNRLVEAEGFSRGAYEGFLRTLGREAPQTLVAANNLAGFLRRVDRLDESERIYRETYEIRLRTLGEDDLDTLASMNNLSMMLMFRGKQSEAEPVLLKALRGCRRMFGESHPKTLLVTNNYAKLLHRLGRLEEAASRYRDILDVRRQTLTSHHPDIMLSLNNLGMVLKEQDKIDEARGILAEVVDAYYGDDPPAQPAHWGSRGKGLFSHHVLFQLADIHVRLKNADAVERLFERAISHREGFQDDDQWRLGIVHREYGLCLPKLGRKANARKQLRDALEVLRHTLEPDDPRTREVHEDLRALDDPGEGSAQP